MEKAQQFWMLMDRRELMKTSFQAWKTSMNDSWEEKAFAEDSSGRLGGCIWPPRSYSCSFCKRDFRSAQALGGHMNVHRRDRARLKQSLTDNNNGDHHQNDNVFQYQNHFPSSLVSSRVSASSTKENLNDHTIVSPYPCSIVQEMLHIPNPKLVAEKNSEEEEDDLVETEFMDFNVIGPDQSSDISRKRRKTAVSFLIKPCLSDKYSIQSKVVEDTSSLIMEDIDLELRLGESPLKVK